MGVMTGCGCCSLITPYLIGREMSNLVHIILEFPALLRDQSKKKIGNKIESTRITCCCLHRYDGNRTGSR